MTNAPGRDPEPPRAITYQKPQWPADLSEAAWGHVVRITELIKQIAPSDEGPESVFEFIAEAQEAVIGGYMIGRRSENSVPKTSIDQLTALSFSRVFFNQLGLFEVRTPP